MHRAVPEEAREVDPRRDVRAAPVTAAGKGPVDGEDQRRAAGRACTLDPLGDLVAGAHPVQLVERLGGSPGRSTRRLAGERTQADRDAGGAAALATAVSPAGSIASAPAGETITGKARSMPRTVVDRSRCIGNGRATRGWKPISSKTSTLAFAVSPFSVPATSEL